MMWRLIEECKHQCNMLTVQYRMHPLIRQWPSMQYYNNQLIDAPMIAARKESVSKYGAYAFINVISEERFCNYSCYNPQECQQVITLLHELQSKNVELSKQVGIITFYAAQVDYMQQEFNKISWLRGIPVHTVDSYQGNESDYIIISFVRSNPKGGIGFLHDFRRLNVAITRARLALLMVGNAATLSRHGQQDVAQLVRDAYSRNCVFGELTVAKDKLQASGTSGKQAAGISTGKEKAASSRQPQPAPQAVMPVYQHQAAAASSRRPLVIIRPKVKDAKEASEHVSAKSTPAPK